MNVCEKTMRCLRRFMWVRRTLRLFRARVIQPGISRKGRQMTKWAHESRKIPVAVLAFAILLASACSSRDDSDSYATVDLTGGFLSKVNPM